MAARLAAFPVCLLYACVFEPSWHPGALSPFSGFTPARCSCGKGRGRLDRPDLGARLLEDTSTSVNFLSLSFLSCWPGWGLEGFEDPLRSARLFTPFQNLSLSRGFTEEMSEGVGTGRNPLSLLGFQGHEAPNAALCCAAPVWPPWRLQAGRPGQRRVSIGDAHAPLTARWTSCLPAHLSPARELPGPGVTLARGHPGVEGLRSPLTNQERCSEGGVVWGEGVAWQRPEGHPSCCLVCRLTHLCLREPLAGQVPSWPWCPRGTRGSWPGVAGHLLTI